MTNCSFQGLQPKFDVVIAGSGPVGATYARQLVEAGYKVAMFDVGEMSVYLLSSLKASANMNTCFRDSGPKIGSHKKNASSISRSNPFFI
jgi:glycine/D-amino acid oxidase-like deaminating enzyme